MVAFTLPQLPCTLLPKDGAWHESPAWTRLARRLADEPVIAAATRRLREVFTSEWSHSLPSGEHAAHPFEYWLMLGGGVPRLVTLGWCLELLDSPVTLTRDMAKPSEFYRRESEAKGAALLVALGARIEWLDERKPGGKRPEGIARWEDGSIAFEVKQLCDGDADRRCGQVDHAFHEGFGLGRRATEGTGTVPPHHIVLEPPEALLDELDALACKDDESNRQRAHEVGVEWGRACGVFLAREPAEGRHCPRPGLTIIVHPPSQAPQGHRYELPSTSPSPGLYVRRLFHSVLKKANLQVQETGHPGLVVLERQWPPSWPPGVAHHVGRELQRGRLPGVAAVVMREPAKVVGLGPTAERITVLPGPQWAELPATVHERLPGPCPGCGMRHAVFDPLRVSSSDDGFRRDAEPGDPLRIHDLVEARTTPPARKLQQALELMRSGFELQRAALRSAHPRASSVELAARFRAWQLRR